MSNKQIDELSFASTISDATSIPVNNNSAIYEAEQLTVGTLGNFLGARANAVHNLGDVYTNKSSLATDNPGAVPAWTSEYVINATDVYPDLYTWVRVLHPELCVTRADYDAAISSTGECKYFVVDEVTGSLRFPKYNYTAPDYPWIYCFNAAVPQTTTQGAEYTAALIGKVSKSGDTMTGNLTIGNSNHLRITNSNDASQSLYADNSGSLIISDNTGKGIVLYHDDNNKPWYIGQNGWQPIPWTTNVGEFSTNVTNVITSIPRDFSITLNSGNLTLGTNATVYYPNGTNTFGTYTTASSITLPKNSAAKYFVFLTSNSTAGTVDVNNCFAGTTAPTVTTTYALWYDLTTNKIKYTNDSGSTWTEGCSFPIAVIYNNTIGTVNADGIESVFVGCGYIADVIFRLPGLSGVLPNGLNTNGLENLLCTSDSVYINQLTGTGPVVLHMGYGSAHDSTYFVKSENEPSSNYTLWYKPSENKMYRKNGEGTISNCQEVIYAEAERTNGRISNWQPRTVYRLPDNDKQYNVGKQIGEVYFSESSSAQDNPGGLPLFTGETISSANTLYLEFYNWVLSHTELQISAANYETTLSTYGECPKYVIDNEAKTIRLPKLTNYIKGANTTDGITQSGAGLPNITGSLVGNVDGSTTYGFGAQSNGAFSVTNNGYKSYGRGDVTDRGAALFDASRSSAVYGASTTVTPAHTTLFPWVCAYNSAIPASTAQAAAFQTALTSKADTTLANVTASAGANLNTVGVRTVIETYQNGTSWYRLWSDNWCEQGGKLVGINETDATFLKEFANTNYSLNIQQISVGSTSASYFGAMKASALTTTGFHYKAGQTENPDVSWKAEGYIQ